MSLNHLLQLAMERLFSQKELHGHHMGGGGAGTPTLGAGGTAAPSVLIQGGRRGKNCPSY